MDRSQGMSRRLLFIKHTNWFYDQSGDISSITGGPDGKRFGVNSKGSGTKLLVCKNNTESRANLSIGISCFYSPLIPY